MLLIKDVGWSSWQGYTHRSWFTHALKSQPSNVSYTALQVLATAFFARETLKHLAVWTTYSQLSRSPWQPQRDLEHGDFLYVISLRQLRDAIEDPDRCYDHENVSATMALYLYEVRFRVLRLMNTKLSSEYRLHFERWLSRARRRRWALDPATRATQTSGISRSRAIDTLTAIPEYSTNYADRYFTLSRSRIVSPLPIGQIWSK